jgi:hypothetical protein
LPGDVIGGVFETVLAKEDSAIGDEFNRASIMASFRPSPAVAAPLSHLPFRLSIVSGRMGEEWAYLPRFD